MNPRQGRTARLGDVAEVVTGSTPSTQHPEYYGGPIPFVGPADLGDTEPIRSAQRSLTEAGACQARLVPAEAVLVCCIGATIGKVGFAGVTVATNQQINSLVFNREIVFPRYGFHCCRTLESILRRNSTSTTLPIINKGRFQDLEIFVPTLDQQRRIADILDKVDVVRRKRKEAIALTEELLRSAFLEMFGDPVTNPKGWPVLQLGDTFAEAPRIGSLQPASDSGAHLIVRVGELGGYDVATERCKRVSLLPDELDRFRLCAGDVILARAIGSEAHLGKASVFQGADNAVVFDSHVMRLRFSPSQLLPYIFVQWLRSAGGRARFMREAGRTAVQFNVNAKQIARVEIPLPPISMQHRFMDLFGRCRTIMARQVLAQRGEGELFASLVQRAFCGELARGRVSKVRQLEMFAEVVLER